MGVHHCGSCHGPGTCYWHAGLHVTGGMPAPWGSLLWVATGTCSKGRDWTVHMRHDSGRHSCHSTVREWCCSHAGSSTLRVYLVCLNRLMVCSKQYRCCPWCFCKDLLPACAAVRYAMPCGPDTVIDESHGLAPILPKCALLNVPSTARRSLTELLIACVRVHHPCTPW